MIQPDARGMDRKTKFMKRPFPIQNSSGRYRWYSTKFMHLLNELIELPDSHHDNPLTKVCHPHDQRWSVIGLPAASDFTYLRKTRPCCSIVVSGNKKFSQLKFWLPVFASGCWTNRSCSHSMGLVCTNWRELRSAATQLVWQEGPNTMQRNSLPLNSPLACVSGVEVKSLIHQSPKDEASSQICCHLC